MFAFLDTLLDTLLGKFGLTGTLADIVTYSARAILVILLCFIIYQVAKRIASVIFFRIPAVHNSHIAKTIKRHHLIQRLTLLITPLIVHMSAPEFGRAVLWIRKAVMVYTIIIIIMVVSSVLDIIEELYRQKEMSKRRPIKGLLQVIKIVFIIVFAIVIIASWIGESPLILISGIGAFAAVLSFVFKDTLLGLVAGLQLSTNDMVRIGDWIEVPGHNIDGNITDISLISVTVDNFDNTTSTVPAYTLVSGSFKNWRKMSETGSRRIKRAVNVDVNSVRFCTEEMLDELSKIQYLAPYIREKREAGRTPVTGDGPDSETANTPHLTNLGVFRMYLSLYMKNQPEIKKDMPIFVRQLAYDNRGIPIEIYAFSAKTDWGEYEQIQADIFDHVFAIAPVFGISVYQELGSGDLRGNVAVPVRTPPQQ
jgi:miniconductance mechanosensitive channel